MKALPDEIVEEITRYLKELVPDLKELVPDLKDSPYEDLDAQLEPSIDIRLQWDDPEWQIHIGDSSYDQSHKGYWGYDCITEDTNAEELVRELVEQVEVELAMYPENN